MNLVFIGQLEALIGQVTAIIVSIEQKGGMGSEGPKLERCMLGAGIRSSRMATYIGYYKMPPGKLKQENIWVWPD